VPIQERFINGKFDLTTSSAPDSFSLCIMFIKGHSINFNGEGFEIKMHAFFRQQRKQQGRYFAPIFFFVRLPMVE
jgi:hypothetical protein